MNSWETQLRKGVIELAILAWVVRGETYGYEVVEQLRVQPGLALTESTVYPVLTRLARRWLPGGQAGPLGDRPPAPLLPADRSRPIAAQPDDSRLANPRRLDQFAPSRPRDPATRGGPRMTTAVASPSEVNTLNEEAQSLIDARLDTIERMLAGRTTRGDRLAIVREVEAQLQEYLAERTPGDTDGDAVIAALARLDPPEAFLADGMSPARPARHSSPVRPRVASSAPPRPIGATAARMSALVGLAGVLTFLLMMPGVFRMLAARGRPDGLLLILPPLLGLVYFQSITAVGLAAYSRFVSRWAIIGICLGLIAAALGAVGPLFLMLH